MSSEQRLGGNKPGALWRKSVPTTRHGEVTGQKSWADQAREGVVRDESGTKQKGGFRSWRAL